MTVPFSAEGRVALVTGSTRGLGLAMARALAEHGATVVLHGRKEADAAARADELRAAGLQAEAIGYDVGNAKACHQVVPAVLDRLGRLDILVNNAGIIHRSPLAEHGEAEWRRVIEVNLNACFLLAQAAAAPMREKGWGRIINIASIQSVSSRPTIPAYVSSKHAIAGLTKALATELGPDGITVNAIGPGYFATEINTPLMADRTFDSMVRSRTPVGRWGQPEELGGAVVFLASEAAGYVNGHLLIVDGGMTTSLY
jgi:gluconate 5-dehydrogenase